MMCHPNQERRVSYAVKIGSISTALIGLGICLFSNQANALACSYDSYTGTVCLVPQNWCPAYTVMASGQELEKSSYPALYSLIGDIYGQASSTSKFKVPNLIGRSLVGLGAQTTGQNWLLGTVGGVQSNVLTPTTMPAHNHGATLTMNYTTESVTIPAVSSSLTVSPQLKGASGSGGQNTLQSGYVLGSAPTGATVGAAAIYRAADSAATDAAIGGVTSTVTGTAKVPQRTVPVNQVTGATVTLTNSGANPAAAFTNYQPSLGMTFCVVTDGDYPVRPD